MVESALLAALGGVLGLMLAFAGERGLQQLIPANTVPYRMTFTDVNDVLKAGGRSGIAGPRERRWTTVFLIAEFGLTMMFTAALVVSFRSMLAGRQADLVIHPSNLLTGCLTLPADRYQTALRYE